jgi:glucoamylase
VAWARAGIVLGAVALAVVALSGEHRDDPRTPAGLPGLPAPFFATAVIGSGGRTAAIDAYGNVVDLRLPGPAGDVVVAVSAKRQAAATVAPDEAIVARAELRDGRSPPLWRADSVVQRYLPGTNVLRTAAWFGDERVVVVRRGRPGSAAADRSWLTQAQPLGTDAPRWARAMYRRSLLVLRALTDRRTGAVAAGARDGWAYVWPRDTAAVAIAFASAGYPEDARRVARFLLGLDLSAAARFHGTGDPVEGRAAQGDAAGWVAAAVHAAGLGSMQERRAAPDARLAGQGWRDRADYQEGDAGAYLGNAIASADDESIAAAFQTRRGLARAAGEPDSGLDSAAAWVVRPFSLPALYPAARLTLLRLVAQRRSRFGIVPSERWHGGEDPWTAPTAWTAWALAALARKGRARGRVPTERRAALSLMTDLRRAATPLGLLPERVDAVTGLPTSTTPLAWSHAFAILALRELWPGRAGS